MANVDIRKEIRQANLYHWQVADRYGIADGNFSRKLRRELSDEDKAKIRAIITELREEEAQTFHNANKKMKG